MKTFKMVLIFLFLITNLFAQKIIDNNANSLLVQPNPKKVISLNKTLILEEANAFIPIITEKSEEKKTSNYLIHLLKNQFNDLNVYESNPQAGKWKIKIELKKLNQHYVNDQQYTIKCDVVGNEIVIASPSQLGLLYGVVTFFNYIQNENGQLKINLFDVEDYPEYKRRIFSTVLKSETVEELLNYALLNKMETVAIASRTFSWFQIDDEYKVILEKIKAWRDKYGGPEIMQSHNIYDKRQIVISNAADLANLKKVIEVGLQHGADKLMILADDTPPFKYGEGYVLTNDNDKKQFKDMAEAHNYLITDLKSWMNDNSYNSEIYYVPAFYTYEDMHYGDMELFNNTPWEDDAYKPLQHDLNYLGANLPEDVYVIWCGPNVRSRKITLDDLKYWTDELKGRVPFLWDNTIYSHHPFTSTPLFTAYENIFPIDFSNHTAGNGMFVNGDTNAEDSRAAMITVNDYLWNPSSYNPIQSINSALERNYGKKLVEPLLEFKTVELGLRKTIGERKLWFEADTLWQVIRKIRFITDKNPFSYHLNYTRMKGLRLQLKNSVPEPKEKENFINDCKALDQKRKNILEKIKLIDAKNYEKIKSIMIPLPDFQKIQ
jgi:hypothetical protein